MFSPNQSLSHGTLRMEDLIPCFVAALESVGEDCSDICIPGFYPDLEGEETDEDELGYVLEDLFDRLEAHAPQGCYFGSHPGDGADFGFWQVEELY